MTVALIVVYMHVSCSYNIIAILQGVSKETLNLKIRDFNKKFKETGNQLKVASYSYISHTQMYT